MELRASGVASAQAGRSKLEELRGAGEDPAHTEATRQRRGEADPEVFRREILPGLQAVSLGTMARATGLSEGYCSFVRRGIKVPYQRHWGRYAG